MNKLMFISLAFAMSLSVNAQESNGGISPDMLQKIEQSYQDKGADRALRNAIIANPLKKLALNQDNHVATDTYFSNEVKSSGISNQKQSGRCWLFTGLNVMRAQAIAKYHLGSFQFSQDYCFFWDQLEKSNLFLQGVIDSAKKPMDDKMVEWLFKNPLSDGGQFTGICDIITKYGVVPKEVMPETESSDDTAVMSSLLERKLREDALELRDRVAKKEKTATIQERKTDMLANIYRILVLNLGKPPVKFTWTRRDKDSKPINTKEYTPNEFYKEYVGNDLVNGYIMFMNDPTREFHKLYTIDFDRHTYDGHNWTYINLPMNELKKMAISSIKDSTMMYLSCDVGKELNKETGRLDLNNYDYGLLLGTTFGMNKKQRIQSFDSGSTHAMTLMAVDLDEKGVPKKWEVENSWGADYGFNGHLIMTDDWFDAYVFRLVVSKKYVPQDIQEILNQKPIRLPAWDPMFSNEQ